VVRFEQAYFVSTCFQKKSPEWTRTAKTDVEMIERPPKDTKEDLRGMGMQASQKRQYSRGDSGNVFADLGLPDAAELDTKVRLAVRSIAFWKSRRLTQASAPPLLSNQSAQNFPRSHTLARWVFSRTV